MTSPLTLGPVNAPELAGPQSRPEPNPAAEAARQFEGLLIRQLLSVLRKTAPQGGLLGQEQGGASEMYLDMFDQALSDSLSQGGGLGLHESLERALSGEARAQRTVHTTRPMGTPVAGIPYSSPLLPSASGATARLKEAAEDMIGPEVSRNWSRRGTLGPADLASDLAVPVDDGVARFTVRDALGFEGYYKCNLFAFELARRAGYTVPVVGRERGWGYMGADRVARDAADDGQVRANWARVATGEGAQALDDSIRNGHRAFMLAASSAGERPGHMAIIERIHKVDYGPDGNVRRIVFDGWEARPSGAQHLTQRTWNLAGNEGGTLPHNGFDNIEILELRRAPSGARPELPISRPGGASIRDDSGSSSSIDRPMERMEERR